MCTNIDESDYEDYNDDALREINYIKEFKKIYPKAKIGLVISMTSLRKSLQNVFKRIPGLKPDMVMSPSDTFKKNEKYDLLIVDESHRLRQYKNIGWLGAFKKNNRKLGLDDTGTELDWIIANSKNQIFFYDASQSVKPSDIDEKKFSTLINDKNTLKLELTSQMRVQGGNNYIKFVDDLLNINLKSNYIPKDYELLIFDSLKDLYSELSNREESYGLCRLIAGYSWFWESDPKRKPKPTLDAIDIEIDGLQFQWNQTDKDWIHSPNAFKEIGCIHTTQGYDLNYTGVIFGKEINFNKTKNKIEINPKLYFDKYGKNGISDVEDLRAYIINIYKTIMYRGIKGTFVYACNKELREYLKQHISTYKKNIPFRILRFDEVKPFVNSVPLVDISVAAGNFSDLQIHSGFDTWIELPINITAKKGYFVCKIIGESMNKKIPNGSYCLFREDNGGSRNGEIVLAESSNKLDLEFGSRYTVKEYKSEKEFDGVSWKHKLIHLKPQSYNSEYSEIVLTEDELIEFKIRGIFVCVLC